MHLVEGFAESAVRVLIYEDLQCPDCAWFRQVLDVQLLPKYGDKVAFEHRDFPLPKHFWARKEAIAARYFGSIRSGLEVDFRRYALENLRDIATGNFNAHLAAFAEEHGVDKNQAAAALGDSGLGAQVTKDYKEAVAAGITKTPTVVVNGQLFIESFPETEIGAAIEAALRRVEFA